MGKKNRTIKVIAYLSVVNATEKNVEWKEDKQLRYIREYAKAHCIRIVKILRRNILGKNVRDAQFRKMIGAIECGMVDGIIVCKMALISDTVVDAYKNVGDVVQAGGHMITVDEGELNLPLKM